MREHEQMRELAVMVNRARNPEYNPGSFPEDGDIKVYQVPTQQEGSCLWTQHWEIWVYYQSNSNSCSGFYETLYGSESPGRVAEMLRILAKVYKEERE